MKYSVGYTPKAVFVRNLELLSEGHLPASLKGYFWSLWGLSNLAKLGSYALGNGTRVFDSVDELVQHQDRLRKDTPVAISQAQVVRVDCDMTARDLNEESIKHPSEPLRTFTMDLTLGGGEETIKMSYPFTVARLKGRAYGYNDPLVGARIGDNLTIYLAFYEGFALTIPSDSQVTNDAHYQRYTQAKEKVSKLLPPHLPTLSSLRKKK